MRKPIRLVATSLIVTFAGSLAYAQEPLPPPALPPPALPPPAAQAPPPPPPAPAHQAPPPAVAPAPPAQAQVAPAPAAPAPAASASPPAKRRSTSFLGIGPAYAGAMAAGSTRARSVDSYGVVLEGGKNIPLAEQVDLGLRFAWGLTAWERFDRWGKAGYDIGAWTTEAYSDVYDWTRKHSGDPNTHGLRIMGGFFAFMTLWIGYIIAGMAYAIAVISPTTFLEADLTGNYNFGDDELNPYVKLGVGAIGFIHPDYGNLRGGLGPTVGFGLRTGGIHLGANMTWSLPGFHGEPGSGSTHLLVGGLTIGVAH